MFNIAEAIVKRRSVRTFDGNPLKAEDAEKILAYANSVENPYGIAITWKLLSEKDDKLSTPVIVGADTFIAGKMKRVPHAEEAFGYAFEQIVLYAESLGIGTTWIGGTMDRKAFEKAIELGNDEVMPCVSPLGYPAEKMSIRESMMRKGVRADWRMDFETLFFDKSFDKPLNQSDAGMFCNALEMVRLSPSAVNKQPWRVVIDGKKAHFYEFVSKGYIDSTGWDMQKVDLGIALYHYIGMMTESEWKYSFEVADPQIAVAGNVKYIATVTALN